MICGKLGMRAGSKAIFNFNLVINEPPMNAQCSGPSFEDPPSSGCLEPLYAQEERCTVCAVSKSPWMHGNGHAFVMKMYSPARCQPARPGNVILMEFLWGFEQVVRKTTRRFGKLRCQPISATCIRAHVGEPFHNGMQVRDVQVACQWKQTSGGESKRYFKPSVTLASAH